MNRPLVVNPSGGLRELSISEPLEIGPPTQDVHAIRKADLDAKIDFTYLDFVSFDEVRTNKVNTDGKPIYRRKIDCGALPNATTKTIIIGPLSYYDKIISNQPWFLGSDASSPYYGNLPVSLSGTTTVAYIVVALTGENLIASVFNNISIYNGRQCYTVIEYTKTADEPGQYSPESNVVPTKNHQDLSETTRNQFGSHNATAIAYDETASVKEILDDKLDANSGIATNLIDGSDLTPMASQGWIRRNSSLYLPKPDCTVDAVNGNDAQAISEWQTSAWRTTPFKTIQAAVNFVYASGYNGTAQANIMLRAGQTFSGEVAFANGVYIRLYSETANNPATILGRVRTTLTGNAAVENLNVESVVGNGFCMGAEGGKLILLGNINVKNGAATAYGIISTIGGILYTYAAQLGFEGVTTAMYSATGGKTIMEGSAINWNVSNVQNLFYTRTGGKVILGSDFSAKTVSVSNLISVVDRGGEIINSNWLPTKAV